LRGIEGTITAKGARLILIGNGEPRHIPAFRAALHTGARLLCDPDLASFRAVGLERGVWQSFHPKALPGALASLFKGHGFPGIQGDPWQQGGALVLGPGEGGVAARPVHLHQISRHTSDLVKNSALLSALDQAVSARPV